MFSQAKAPVGQARRWEFQPPALWLPKSSKAILNSKPPIQRDLGSEIRAGSSRRYVRSSSVFYMQKGIHIYKPHTM